MRWFLFTLLIVLLTPVFVSAQTSDTIRYRFLVAGHAYGAHAGGNKGLHPPFLNRLTAANYEPGTSLFLTGDIVNESNTESWTTVGNELENLKLDAFYVMGNHDSNATGYEVFQQKHGASFYAFVQHGDLFVVLNSTIGDRFISEEQMLFLQNQLETLVDSVRHIFIFFHEVLWTSHEKYRDLRVNSRSRHAQMKLHSNYWEALHPMLLETGRLVYVFAGDVGGNEDAIALFYDRVGNVRLFASGMGEVEDENYLEVIVEGDAVIIEPIPLNGLVELHPIETYALPEAPDTIVGPVDVIPGSKQVEYSVPEDTFATEVQWYYKGNLSGTAEAWHTLVDFDTNFTDGTISAAYVRDGYGTGSIKELKIKAFSTSVHDLRQDDVSHILIADDVLSIVFPGKIPESCFIEIHRLDGACVFQRSFDEVEMQSPIKILLNDLKRGMYLLNLRCKGNSSSRRIILH